MDRISFVMIIVLIAAGSTVTAAALDAHCSNPHICTKKPHGYDKFQHNMNNLLRKNSEFLKIQMQSSITKDLDDTQSDTNDRQNCEAISTTEMPYAIKTNDSSHLVIQLPTFQQKIKYTRCLDQEASCFGDAVDKDVSAKCLEVMTAVSLYIYDPKYNQMKYKMFDIPVACACKFSKLDPLELQ